MKTLISFFLVGLTLALGVGCTHGRPSAAGVARKRPTVKAADVKVYTQPPAKFKEIGRVWADAPVGGSRATRVSDDTIDSMRQAAAGMGANGILFSDMSSQYVGSIGASFGTPDASQVGIGTTGSSAGHHSSSAIFARKITALAIFVTQE
jgi:hypothetical protein